MKTRNMAMIVLLAASAARADRPMPSKLREGWREARNNLLWWRPYDTFDGTNAAFELEHGLAPGGAIRYFGGELMKELAKPDGGDSNRVADALNRLVRGGNNGPGPEEYYERGLQQSLLVRRLVMYGYTTGGIDLSAGPVYGLKRNYSMNNHPVGVQSLIRNPTHQ